MRQVHREGEKLFIDYSGKTVPVINAVTGEIVRAEIFIASMGASKYTYAEATWTQSSSSTTSSRGPSSFHTPLRPPISRRFCR